MPDTPSGKKPYRISSPQIVKVREQNAYSRAIADYRRAHPGKKMPPYLTVLESSLNKHPRMTMPIPRAQEHIQRLALQALATDEPSDLEAVSREVVKAVTTDMAANYFGDLSEFISIYLSHYDADKGGLQMTPEVQAAVHEVANSSALLLRQIRAVLPEFKNPNYLYGQETRDQALARLSLLIDFDKVEELSGFVSALANTSTQKYYITVGETVVDEIESRGFPPELILLYLTDERDCHIYRDCSEPGFEDEPSYIGEMVPLDAEGVFSILKNGTTIYISTGHQPDDA